jgi:hypothetical protein
MSISSPIAPHAAAKPRNLRDCKINRQLQRFNRHYRKQIIATAHQHMAFADLAVSFPALLFVIAVQHPQINTAALKQDIIKGQSLKSLAATAKLPMWIRKLQPEAFSKLIGPLPRHDIYARQIVNHLPRRARHAAFWLNKVTQATAIGDEAFAVWLARECDARRQHETALRKMALWAWFSLRPELYGSHFITKPWRPQMKHAAARSAADEWHERLKLHLTIAEAALQPQWLEPKTVDGFDFVPLLSAKEIHEEARIMQNCIYSYGRDIACDYERLWSMRINGQRMATLSVGPNHETGLLCITQIKARKNEQVSREVAVAAMRWFNSHDTLSIVLKQVEWNEVLPNRKAWVQLFKPYWLEKTSCARWLPMAPTVSDLDRF